MLEIFVLVAMCRYLSGKAKGKGWPGWPFGLLMVIGWFAFAFGFGIAGLIAFGGDDDLPLGAILGYIIGAVFACLANAILVGILPDRSTKDEDYDDPPRRRRDSRRHDEDDEGEEDRRRSSRRDRDDGDDLDDRNWRPRRHDDDR